MSIVLPTRSDAVAGLVDVEYFDATEVAQRLGLTARTVQRHTTGHIGDWPHVKVWRSPYLSEDHIARVVELLTHDPDRIAEGDRPARLGVPCTANQLEDVER